MFSKRLNDLSIDGVFADMTLSEGDTLARAGDQELQLHELLAIETYFEGDAAFYSTFKSACREQFKTDVHMGDEACAHADAPGLRRVAHSLKSVLLTLGYADLSHGARALEQLAQQEPWGDAVAAWQDLRQRLIQTFSQPG